MTMTYKVLAQSSPSATTATDLYTVPGGTSTVISTLTICNRSATAGSYRIAIRPAGVTLDNTHYVVYDNAIAGNDSVFLTIGVTVATTDVLTVYASSADMTFSAFGSEIS